jgi:hypothetical protein
MIENQQEVLKQMPERSPDLGSIMSNFDHMIEPNAEELLRNGAYGHYSGREFYGERVWFEDDRFYCEVWRYHAHVDTVEAESLAELIEAVCEKWGYE